jgi:pantoate--beta-alanine ligase
MYPDGFETSVEAGRLSTRLCGLQRPSHFKGVATAVLKLFNIVMPRVAVFGKKDYQQFVLVRRMVEDLNLEIEVVGVDTVREHDGVAMSSRNSYLSAAERKAAACIPRSLDAASRLYSSGERKAARIVEEVEKTMREEPLAALEYVSVCDPETLEELDCLKADAVAALAARIGRARLIDNRLLSEKA